MTTPVHTNAEGKAGLEDIQVRTGIYTVPKQVQQEAEPGLGEKRDSREEVGREEEGCF